MKIQTIVGDLRFINDILLFIIMIAGIIIFISRSVPPKPRIPPKPQSLPIVQKTDPIASEKSIDVGPRPAVLNDFLVFEITNNKVIENYYPNYDMQDGPGGPGSAGGRPGGYAGSGRPGGRATVNLLFVKNDGSIVRTLFKENCLMLSHSFAFMRMPSVRQIEGEQNSKNTYLVVTEDNGSGEISEKGRKDLYVSDYDGNNLKMVLQSVDSYYPLDRNRIFISQKEQQNTKYYSYDLVNGILVSLINTKDFIYSKKNQKAQ
jgi:hypothetical protein